MAAFLDSIKFGIRRKLEQFQNLEQVQAVRKWINNHPGLIVGTSIGSFLVLLIIIIVLLWPEKALQKIEYKKGWFYDLNTGQLFVDNSSKVPPIDAPSGLRPNGQAAGVKAYVFSYAFDPNENERFIGFLEMPDPNAGSATSEDLSMISGKSKNWGEGKLVRSPEFDEWVPANSNLGRMIISQAFLPNENGETPVYCPPP
ncbi:MAG: hypothetical protein ACYTE8_03840 [Planctomycetota bacterium]|jgi:hypothetical protein